MDDYLVSVSSAWSSIIKYRTMRILSAATDHWLRTLSGDGKVFERMTRVATID